MSAVTTLSNNNPTLASVQRAFDHWRSTRTTRSRTPISLQQRAVALRGRYPASHICRALKINDSALKRWAGESSPASTVRTAAVVELPTEPRVTRHADLSNGEAGLLTLCLSDTCQLQIRGRFTLAQILDTVRQCDPGKQS